MCGWNLRKVLAALFVGIFSIVPLAMPTSAAVVDVTATFTNFFNQGEVSNNSDTPIFVTDIIFTLGTPEPGIGTWNALATGGIAGVLFEISDSGGFK